MGVKTREVAVIYPSGVCNLQCRYCGIDKNPALKDIDKKLAESFQGDYYFDQIRKYFPNRGQLTRIETWGGEPFLHMDRAYPLIDKLIQTYPYLREFYSSTNFSYPAWCDQLFGLIDVFNKYDYRDFDFFLQLSCDGPEYINDAGRGKGTTKKCLDNFNKFLSLIEDKVGENINLCISVKPTLDINNLHILNTKEKIIEYYQFFEENFVIPVAKLNYTNVKISPPIPNTAVPTPATKEDGEYFAWYCKTTRQIQKENQQYHYFQYYDDITMFSRPDVKDPAITYKYEKFTCGVGVTVIGFLPDGMVTSCHEGFVNLAEEYKLLAGSSDRVNYGTIQFDEFVKDRPVKLCLTPTQWTEFEREMDFFEQPGSTARLASLTNEIFCLAMAGQIDEKYLQPENALKAAIFCQNHSASTCIKDNYNVTGSILLQDNGMLKMFLNGAIDYIKLEGDVTFDE